VASAFVITNDRHVLTDGVFGMSDTAVMESIGQEIEVLRICRCQPVTATLLVRRCRIGTGR
jgi:hypothetical protein